MVIPTIKIWVIWISRTFFLFLFIFQKCGKLQNWQINKNQKSARNSIFLHFLELRFFFAKNPNLVIWVSNDFWVCCETKITKLIIFITSWSCKIRRNFCRYDLIEMTSWIVTMLFGASLLLMLFPPHWLHMMLGGGKLVSNWKWSNKTM